MKLVILDRDGVINWDSDAYIKNTEEWIPVPGSIEAIAALNKAGYTTVVLTNQTGVKRGYFTEETLGAIHQKMCDAVKTAGGEISNIYKCLHMADENCDCRKPKTALYEQVFQEYPDALRFETVCIGDSLKDMQAGLTMGCRCYFVADNGKRAGGVLPDKETAFLAEHPTVVLKKNLADVVGTLLG